MKEGNLYKIVMTYNLYMINIIPKRIIMSVIRTLIITPNVDD
jgi:hypothetical protein